MFQTEKAGYPWIVLITVPQSMRTMETMEDESTTPTMERMEEPTERDKECATRLLQRREADRRAVETPQHKYREVWLSRSLQ